MARTAIDFDPLSSALRDGGPPYLSEEWRAWVRERQRRRTIHDAAPVLAGVLGVPAVFVDQLISIWDSEQAVREFSDPDGPFGPLLDAVEWHTATWLAEHGITSAWLWRGEAIPGPRHRQRQAVTLPVRAHATPVLDYAVSMAVTRVAEQGMPLGRLLLFRVEADRIVGTSRTGLGHPDSAEVVVDGGDVEAFVWPVGPRDRHRVADPSFARRLLSEARWAPELQHGNAGREGNGVMRLGTVSGATIAAGALHRTALLGEQSRKAN